MSDGIRIALRDTGSWPRVRRALRALSNAELREAEALERLGKRRKNMLMLLKSERNRRRGKPAKMLRLRVEVRQ